MALSKAMRIVLIITLSLILATGCSSRPEDKNVQSVITPEVIASETGSPPPLESENAESDINFNDTGKTVIKAISLNRTYPNNSYLIITKEGTTICVDPTQTIEGVKPDIIAMTHSHSDHVDTQLVKNFPEIKTTKWTAESFEEKGIKVTGIASSHLGDTIPSTPSNVIYVFEVDGLRIAHMGDIGQAQLTDEQLEALGTIDIAFMQFVNSYSGYSFSNEKGIKLIEQLKPQIIIPTHSSAEATESIGKIVGDYELVDDVLVISKDDLSDGKRKVIEIKNTHVLNK